MCDSLGKHCLSTARWAVHEHPSRRVDANLLVQLKVGQRKLHCLSHLLLLDVHTTCEWEGRGGREEGREGGEGGQGGWGKSRRAKIEEEKTGRRRDR